MNKVKSLLLGSAATLIAVTGAQAADMPMTPAREPVYQCDIAGFYEIPGSDICLRISGFARFWMGGQNRDNAIYGFVDGGDSIGDTVNGVPLTASGDEDPFFMDADFRVRFDARTATELGTVRAFAELQAGDSNGNTGGALNLRQAFVQVGNWVFGKTGSTFTVNRTGANYTNAISTLDAITVRVVQVRYTQPFGNGFAISVAIEDPSYVKSLDINTTAGSQSTVVHEFPNFVANLAYTGDRVAASLGALLAYNNYWDGFGTDDEIGWAIQGSIEFAATDAITLGLLGNYSDGASQYGNDILRGGATNTLMNGAGAVTNTTEIWAASGFVTYAFSPELATNIIFGYGERSGGVVAGLEVFAGTVNAVWTPVDNLEFILEFNYAHEDVANTDDYMGVFQVRRSF